MGNGYTGNQLLKRADMGKVARLQWSLAGSLVEFYVLVKIILTAFAYVGYICLDGSARGMQVNNQLIDENRFGAHVGEQT
ncbi:hypothetical protein ACFQDN_06385 [Pseudomonas asuensis]